MKAEETKTKKVSVKEYVSIIIPYLHDMINGQKASIKLDIFEKMRQLIINLEEIGKFSLQFKPNLFVL